MKRKIIFGLVVLFVAIQFKRINKENPVVNKPMNYVDVMETPSEVSKILINACYDCHSFETKYPWYTNIAPLSWWIEHHIDEGRDEFNFSEWGKYSLKKKDHKMEEIAEMVAEEEMPLPSYLPMHPEADLTDDQRKLLIDWAEGVRNSLK